VLSVGTPPRTDAPVMKTFIAEFQAVLPGICLCGIDLAALAVAKGLLSRRPARIPSCAKSDCYPKR